MIRKEMLDRCMSGPKRRCKIKDVYCEYWIDDEYGCILDYYSCDCEKQPEEDTNESEKLPFMSSE